MSFGTKWLLVWLVLAVVVFILGSNCENSIGASSDCSTTSASIAGVLALIAFGGWILMPIILGDGDRNRRDAKSSQPSNAEQLATIALLRDEGRLTEAEYEAEKARILGGGGEA